MSKKTYNEKVRGVLARAYNLSDAFEATIEELHDLLDSLVEEKRQKHGEDSEQYRSCVEARRRLSKVINKVQKTHLEGFDLLIDFVKKQSRKG